MSVDEIVRDLSKPQKMGMLELSPTGYMHKGLWTLSRRGYKQLLDRGLIIEVWTWLDYTRPSIGLTELGRRVREALCALYNIKSN